LSPLKDVIKTNGKGLTYADSWFIWLECYGLIFILMNNHELKQYLCDNSMDIAAYIGCVTPWLIGTVFSP
jgi:hypothetical protein